MCAIFKKEMKQDITERYRKLNESYQKKLIFRTGIDAGFFAEYTYMLNAMLYCLVNKIQFKLYSADANYGFSKGWTDYFLPFCEEVDDTFLKKWNRHAIPSYKKILNTCICQCSLNMLKWKIKLDIYAKIAHLKAKNIYGEAVLLNSDVQFNHHQHFYIPELDIDGDYIHAFKKMVEITWNFNSLLVEQIKYYKDFICLPDHYIGIQVRGGDKITEVGLLSPKFFVDRLKQISENHIFVLTDDYRLFEELQSFSPNKQWYTLCSPDEKGYVNSKFIQSKALDKQKQMIRFLVSMQLLLSADIFMGSITPGPSLFVLKNKYPNCIPIDCMLEQLKVAATLPIAGRGDMANRYLQELVYND